MARLFLTNYGNSLNQENNEPYVFRYLFAFNGFF